MRWQGMRQSGNVEDRRGAGAGFPMGGMGGGGFRTGGLGLGGIVILVLAAWLFGVDPSSLLDPNAPLDSDQPVAGNVASVPPSDEAGRMVSAVLGDTEDAWTRIFADAGLRYQAPRLVMFDDAYNSACGYASAAVGPFYCPRDRKVYIDLTFFNELDRRFGAPGDFAQAYVVAHEVGHHVQNLFGLLSGGASNEQSVRQELQADCLAGVWGRSAGGRNYLEEGDVEEGLRAAAAIGDDRIQRATRGRVVPESFTHGSSAQRVDALKRGLSNGTFESCGIRPR